MTNAITAVNYEMQDVFFPYRFALGHALAAGEHIDAACESGSWDGRIVQIITHAALGLFELIPLVNLIVALFDKIIYEMFIQEAPSDDPLQQRPPEFIPPPARNNNGAPVQNNPPQPPPASPARNNNGAPVQNNPPQPPPEPPANQRVADMPAAAVGSDLQKIGIDAGNASQKLGCRIQDLGLRGLHAKRDLDALGLNLFSQPLEQFVQEIDSLKRELKQALGSEEEFDLEERVAPHLERLQKVSEAITEVHEVMLQKIFAAQQQVFQAGIPALGAKIVLDVLKEKAEELITALPSLRQENEQIHNEVAKARALRTKILGLVDPIERLLDLLTEVPSLQASVDSLKALKNRLNVVKKQFTDELGSEEAPGLIENLANSIRALPSLAQSLQLLRRADQEWQAAWLKAYVTQQDVTLFWKRSPSIRGLAALRAKQPELKYGDLFTLSYRVPQAPAQEEAQEDLLDDRQAQEEADRVLALELQGQH